MRPARISFQRGCNHAVVPKAEMVAVADDDMIEHLNADHLACLDQPPGEQNVFLARFGIAARVVVDKDDRRGRFADRGLKGIARMYDGGGKAADRNYLLADDLVLGIEQGAAKYLFFEVLHSWPVVRCNVTA